MKVAIGTLLRSATKPTMFALGSVAVVAVLAGCGDKESDPDAVSVEDLKFPGGLSITDNGNGSAKLWWSGSNNEPDFDGYNVYGMKGTETSLNVKAGQALQFLDTEGEPIQASRDILAKFNYDLTTKLESAGTGAAAANAEGEEPEFSALPIHGGTAEARLLPTCMNVGGTCTMTTEATKGQTVSDNSAFAVNGPISYDVADLKVGESYCFLVLSSMDGGTKVSQTSSNVECVVPNYKATFTLPELAANDRDNTSLAFDIAGVLAACTDAGCTITEASFTAEPPSEVPHTAASTGSIYLERGSGAPEFIAGKNSGVIDLGYSTGFGDPLLPSKAPGLVLDENGFIAGGGYSAPGQSIFVKAGHMYVFAVGDSSLATTDAFKYHWVFVGEDGAAEMRLQK